MWATVPQIWKVMDDCIYEGVHSGENIFSSPAGALIFTHSPTSFQNKFICLGDFN